MVYATVILQLGFSFLPVGSVLLIGEISLVKLYLNKIFGGNHMELEIKNLSKNYKRKKAVKDVKPELFTEQYLNKETAP